MLKKKQIIHLLIMTILLKRSMTIDLIVVFRLWIKMTIFFYFKLKSKIKKSYEKLRRDAIFQKSDPPEAPLAPKKPYLEVKNSRKSLKIYIRCHFSKSDPPEAPLAPKKPFLNQDDAKMMPG